MTASSSASPSAFDSPAVRVAGAVGSWLLFAFSLVVFLQATSSVLDVGGSCAWGGPYVPARVCPESVVVFAPLGILGVLVSWALAVALPRGLGVSLVAWGWPILFVGIGAQFVLAGTRGQGIVVNLVCGLLALGMGLLPAWFFVRRGALAPTLVGTRSLGGTRFAFPRPARRFVGRPAVEGEPEVPPGALDGLVSTVLWLVGAGVGSWLGILAFAAVAAG